MLSGLSIFCQKLFQFPPLREGRQPALPIDCKRLEISIPAPARGATRLWEKEVSPRIFQFPPLREGRRG